MRLAIEDMEKEFPGRYDGATHRLAVAQFERDRAALLQSLADGQNAETESVEKRLAGIRAAWLWRQVGGSRWKIVFGRNKLLEAAQHYLRMSTH